MVPVLVAVEKPGHQAAKIIALSLHDFFGLIMTEHHCS